MPCLVTPWTKSSPRPPPTAQEIARHCLRSNTAHAAPFRPAARRGDAACRLAVQELAAQTPVAVQQLGAETAPATNTGRGAGCIQDFGATPSAIRSLPHGTRKASGGHGPRPFLIVPSRGQCCPRCYPRLSFSKVTCVPCNIATQLFSMYCINLICPRHTRP
jgi:hypothetical protein